MLYPTRVVVLYKSVICDFLFQFALMRLEHLTSSGFGDF